MSDRNRDEPQTDTGGGMDERESREDANARDVESRVQDPNPGEHGKGLSAIIALLGIWMILEAVLVDLVAAQMWSDALVGMALLVIGVYNYSRRSDKQLGSIGAATLVAILGLWLIAAPFLLGLDGGFAETVNDIGFWNDVVVGLIVFGLGAYSVYEIRDRRRDVRRTTAG